VLEHADGEAAPGLSSERQTDGSWRLAPEEFPAITLAGGTGEGADRCRAAFEAEVRQSAGLEAWQSVQSDLAALASGAAQLQPLLATVIERGDFRGRWALCADYFAHDEGASRPPA